MSALLWPSVDPMKHSVWSRWSKLDRDVTAPLSVSENMEPRIVAVLSGTFHPPLAGCMECTEQ